LSGVGRTTVAELAGGTIGQAASVLAEREAGLRQGTSPDDVHKARVATRRLRSDLRSLDPLVDPEQTEPLRAEAAWFGGMLGAVRDADVLAPLLVDGLTALGGVEAEEVARLRCRLAEQRVAAHADLVRVLDGERYRALLDALDRHAVVPPLRPGVDPRARADRPALAAAETALRRVERAVRRLPEPAPNDDLHEVRKRTKRARYAAELASPLTDGRTAGLARRLTRLQDDLGAHQDAVTLRAWLAGLPHRELDGSTAFAAGRLVGALTVEIDRGVGEWWGSWQQVLRRRDRVRAGRRHR
jgi:CHAD domain-containing protein